MSFIVFWGVTSAVVWVILQLIGGYAEYNGRPADMAPSAGRTAITAALIGLLLALVVAGIMSFGRP